MNWLWMAISLAIVGTAIVGTTIMIFFRQANSLTARSADLGEFHEGQVFPTMVLPSLSDGRPGSVADFRGKKLILHIVASW